ncbi:MAG: hypothetical protein JWP57_3824 [Spirosoma sp.]|nr:hypothetical protein [Spirosoma sp.]
MKIVLAVTLLTLLPALAIAQRESIKSSNKYNSAAMRVSDKEKQKATSEKFNGQKPNQPPKPKPHSGKQPIQGATENGNRIKNSKSTGRE